MKNMNGFTKRLVCALLSVLLCVAVLPSMAKATLPMFPWLDYTLRVTLCTDDLDDITKRNFPVNTGERLVRVVFEGVYMEINNDDIDKHCEMFALRDEARNEYGVRGSAVHGISLADGKFNTNPMQEGFDLFYVIPISVPLNDLALLVETDQPNERIVVRMTDVPREVSAADSQQ